MTILFVVSILIAISCLVIDTDVDTDIKVEGDINVTGDVPDPTDTIVKEAKNAFGLYEDDDSGTDKDSD